MNSHPHILSLLFYSSVLLSPSFSRSHLSSKLLLSCHSCLFFSMRVPYIFFYFCVHCFLAFLHFSNLFSYVPQALGYMCDVMDPDEIEPALVGHILSAIIDGMRADRPNEVRQFTTPFSSLEFHSFTNLVSFLTYPSLFPISLCSRHNLFLGDSLLFSFFSPCFILVLQ